MIPPATDCPACCRPGGTWRTKVVIARHPLARLVSYFKMAWLGNRRKGNFSSWVRFPAWLNHVAGLSQLPEVTAAFGEEDEYHTRPVASWLADFGDSTPASQIFSLRLEHLEADMLALQAQLCGYHGYCERLPPLHRRKLEGERGPSSCGRLQGLWADAGVRRTVLAGYETDFDILGYDKYSDDVL
eukprot:TRINITY_DN42461_c0_g1_i1.p1 TRINITY_DN42461_c0_g1~~TRINITY_DN42461_c0_g1_i1.p1  ORF type:complete len:186 (+),score=32.39 TRINITY_DN42461_c0_g1_i1:2-559(+)